MHFIPLQFPCSTTVLMLLHIFCVSNPPFFWKPKRLWFSLRSSSIAKISESRVRSLPGSFQLGNDGSPSNHVFLVEFDKMNGYQERSDTEGNRVGINVNEMKSRATVSATFVVNGTRGNKEIIMESGTPIQAWIEYDGYRKVLNVTLSPLLSPKPAIPLMSENIDLSDYLNYSVYAGFSAATGEKFSSHFILGWSFKLNGMADPLSLDRLLLMPTEKSPINNEPVCFP